MVGVRRSNALSADSGFAEGLDHLNTIEEWVSMKDPFRVVAYGQPMSFPLRLKNGNLELEQLYLTRLQPLVAQTLGQYGISMGGGVRAISFLYHPYEEENGQQTLILNTSDSNSAAWAAAARAILSLFSQNGAEKLVSQMQVEIRNPNKMYTDVSCALDRDEDLISALESIQEKISETASVFLGSSWSSIAYHSRLSRQDRYKKELAKPTVIVFCRPGSACMFQSAEDGLMKILNELAMPVHLEILIGEVSLANGRPLFLRGITQKPQNGASISVEGVTDEAGSLGGWFTLNLPKQKKSIECALTCYHVVRAADQDTKDHTDQNGVRIDDRRGQVTVEYPAFYDAHHTMKLLEKGLQETDDAEFLSDRATLSPLIANPGIGRVILASGHIIRADSRMDWALIQSPQTFSANKPPPRSSFINPSRLPDGIPYSQNSDSKVRSFAPCRVDEWVTKTGRTTKVTSGVISALNREVQWGDGGIKTKEVEVLCEDFEFVLPGDSGSIVLNARGEMLGILFAKDSRANTFDSGFITPIAAIQTHIMEMTDGGFLSLD